MLAALAAVAALTFVGAAPAGDNESGFKTSHPPMVVVDAPGGSAEALLTVGDTPKGGNYMFESIPDGISFKTRGNGRVDVWVNHETSTVPFPVPPTVPVAINDFTNAMLSEISLNQHSGGFLKGTYAIPSEANYQRFCSNFLAGAEHGFERELLFTNEEATDFVNRTGTAFPARPGAEQAGVVVAFDVKSGAYRTIYGMGRHNHENSVAIPGYGHPVVLSGDDTFSAPASQLYLYEASSADAVWNDLGHLFAFRSDVPAINDYGDLSGTSAPVRGTFIPVPDAIARGGQTALENWSNDNNVFQFIRVEDIAYDRDDSNVVYIADTGEPRADRHPTNTRLERRGSTHRGPWPNGRIFKLVLDPMNPKAGELSVLIDADAGGYNNAGVIHQPDNLETTANSLLIQEDPGGHNQSSASFPTATTARIWKYDLNTRSLVPVAHVDQSAQPSAARGAWESSGIIDASQVFGAGWFLVTVQAPTLVVNSAPGPDLNGDGQMDWRYEREGGQFLRIRIPGA
jgi:hypothetical protein